MENKPVVPVHKAEQAMTSLKEANARQKKALDRMLDERNKMLDLFYRIWTKAEVNWDDQEADTVKRLLKENGRLS